MSAADAVKQIISEILAVLIPRARKEVIDRLRDKGITIDQLTERVIELELANLERAFRDVVEEFEKAEARGRAKPLGGPGPWGKFDDDDRDR